MAVIDIGTVLNKFNDVYDERDSVVKDYGIMFITADGRVRTMRSRKNVKAPAQQLKSPVSTRSRGKGMFNLQRHGTILLQDLDKAEARTVKVAMIFGFRDWVRLHITQKNPWLNIRH